MWVFRYFRFVRWWRDGKRLSMRSVLLLPITVPILITQVTLIGIVLAVLFYIAVNLSDAFDLIGRAVADAQSSDEVDEPFLFVKGGEFRQAGDQRRGSTARLAEPKSGDDLRHRLDELRSTRTGIPARRSRNLGGQYGKQ